MPTASSPAVRASGRRLARDPIPSFVNRSLGRFVSAPHPSRVVSLGEKMNKSNFLPPSSPGVAEVPTEFVPVWNLSPPRTQALQGPDSTCKGIKHGGRPQQVIALIPEGQTCADGAHDDEAEAEDGNGRR